MRHLYFYIQTSKSDNQIIMEESLMLPPDLMESCICLIKFNLMNGYQDNIDKIIF